MHVSSRDPPVPGEFWGPCRHCECISDYRFDGRRDDCRALREYLARVLLGRIRLAVDLGSPREHESEWTSVMSKKM